MAKLRAAAEIDYLSIAGGQIVRLEAESTPQVDAMVVNALAELRSMNAIIRKVSITDTRGDSWVYHYTMTPEGVVTHIEKNGERQHG